ncbi:MAG: Uma2 family endonuclease [Caldilineaceae bacterium]
MAVSSIFDVEDVVVEEEFADVGSFNHGYVQARLIIALGAFPEYTPISELSLDVSDIDLTQFNLRSRDELKPDIALYPKRGLSRPLDILRMAEMPLLAVEILSPRQGSYDILEKFRVYFAAGIKSCWLVDPAVQSISVYSAMNSWKTFGEGAVVDEALNLRLDLAPIFS